ncbi:MAG: DUF1214 domain-containing protein [Haliea sp.]|jgi:hypothetical protein|nr:DUF1214 domain-containing protein [Haliea sp.]
MNRRELLQGTALSGIAAALLAPRLALAETPKTADSEAGQALAELQQTLDQLEADMATPAWKLRTPQDFAEGRRVILHALLHGLETWLEADPARPFFRAFIHQHKKLLGDNPDARYFSAVIDDRYRYRIRGNLAGATYTSFTVELAPDPDGPGIGTTLNDSQFKADANGDYEIILSREKEPGNWMALPEGATSITTRHYYERETSINNDRMHHIPIDIENLDPVPPRTPPNDAGIAAGIRRVAIFVKGNVVTMTEEKSPPWVSRVPNKFNPSVIDKSNAAVGYAAIDNIYAMAPFVLGPKQALVIRGRFPKCRFSNLVLFNRFLQTFDYETRTISRNRAQTVQDDEGNFEMIIAHRDPGRPNWLDTEGRPYGIMFWRYQLPEEDIPPLETEVITLD